MTEKKELESLLRNYAGNAMVFVSEALSAARELQCEESVRRLRSAQALLLGLNCLKGVPEVGHRAGEAPRAQAD